MLQGEEGELGEELVARLRDAVDVRMVAEVPLAPLDRGVILGPRLDDHEARPRQVSQDPLHVEHVMRGLFAVRSATDVCAHDVVAGGLIVLQRGALEALAARVGRLSGAESSGEVSS